MSAECLERPDTIHDHKCLLGEKHKPEPSAENSMLACKVYKNNSCCTSNFTKQLLTPVKKIVSFSWTHCNNTLSPKCEAFMVDIECFYRCSHNAIYWENPQYHSSILKAPICASFCDGWFEACKEDLTCAKNWIFDFNFTDGINTCKQPCRNFSDFYSSGKELCEGMWGTSFVYTETDDCLQLNLTETNPNDKLVEKLFGGEGNETKSTVPAFTVNPSTGKGNEPKSRVPAFTVNLFLVFILVMLSIIC